MMKKLMIVLCAALFTAISPMAYAAQPPSSYKTDQVIKLVNHSARGEIPLRRGFWDHEKPNRYMPGYMGEGFGLDKTEHKHNIRNYNLLAYVIANSAGVTQSTNEDNPYGSAVAFDARITTTSCVPSPYSEVPLCHFPDDAPDFITVRAIVEMDYHDFYYDWPASVHDDKIVGLATAYCLGVDVCPDYVDYWTGLQGPETEQLFA